MRNCERHHFSLASASMEYILKNNLPLVNQWTQDIWTKFCAWLMDESEPDAIVLEEGGKPTKDDPVKPMEPPFNAAAMRKALEKVEKLNHYDLGCIRSIKRRDEIDAKILEIERPYVPHLLRQRETATDSRILTRRSRHTQRKTMLLCRGTWRSMHAWLCGSSPRWSIKKEMRNEIH